MPKRRSVKSQAVTAVDEHEKPKNFLTESELEQLLAEMKKGRHGVRDHLLILMMFRHALRVSEATDIRLADLDLKGSRLWVRRLKGSLDSHQPIEGDELRAIKRYLRDRDGKRPWLFLNERGTQMTRQAVSYLIKEAARSIGMEWIHAHTLRHPTGFYLGNKGYDTRLIADYLGHKDIRHTMIYTRVASHRFEGLWRR